MTKTLDLARSAVRSFAIDGELLAVAPHHRGHIHDTFVSTWRCAAGEVRFLHQRLNEHVFTDVDALMHNVTLVTRHLRSRLAMNRDSDRMETLDLVPTRIGGVFLRDDSGAWRTYRFIENIETFDLCPDPARALAAARAFAGFQARLADLDASSLRETIPDFFSSSHRLRQFDSALAGAAPERLRRAESEIRFVEERRDDFAQVDHKLATGVWPTRIVHGDTKLNNVLFDRESGEPVAIVDLDTCMPGWSLYDFGDLVRFTAATAREDELDLGRVAIDIDLFAALVEGYLPTARSFLSDDEIRAMPFSARLVTLTVGSRFLTDFLRGDRYFKIDPARPEHNLERAKVQFALVSAMERRDAELRAIVGSK